MKWWTTLSGRRVEVEVRRAGDRYEVVVDGALEPVELVAVAPGLASLVFADRRSFAVASQRLASGVWRVSLGDREFAVELHDPLETATAAADGAGAGNRQVRAPIPGKVASVAVAPGAAVRAGDPLLVLEAMKMENQIRAEADGRVEQVLVSAGVTVEGGQLLVVIG